MTTDPVDTTSRFGPWLRRRRIFLDLTQDELAQRAICSVSTIRKLERSELIPSKELARTLAAALSVPEAEQESFIAFARDERKSLPASALPGETAQLPPLVAAAPTGALPRPTTLAAARATTQGGPPTSLTPPAPYRPPAQLTELIGREWELLTCEQLLQQPGVRLLTLFHPAPAKRGWP